MMQWGWPFVAWAYGVPYGGLMAYGLFLWYRIDRPDVGDGNEP